MKRFYLFEDVRLAKLPVRYSDKLAETIEDIKFYNRFEEESLKQWLNRRIWRLNHDCGKVF